MIENPVEDWKKNVDENSGGVLSNFLKEYINKLNVRTKNCICSLSGEGLVIHYFEIPEMPEEEIKNAVEIEVLQVLPTGIENIEYDYSVFNVGGKKYVFFVGYPKEKCDFILNVFQKSGLKPLIMDIDGLALVNCYNYVKKNNWQLPVFILNLGHNTTNLSIAQKDGFVFVRDIPFGGNNVINLISETKEISIEESENFIKNEENYQEVQDAVKNSSEELLREIEIGVEYFRTRTGERPSEFLITGGSSILSGLKQLLEEELQENIEIWNPFEYIDENLVPPDIKEQGRFFSISLGLLTRKIE